MIRVRLAAVAVAGATTTAMVAWALGMGSADTQRLVGVAAGSALVAGVAGALALACVRRSSVSAQVTVVALTALTACGAGAFASAQAMFISSHDLDALVVVLVAAGTVGVLAALYLGNLVAEGSRSLEAMAHRIGMGEALDSYDEPGATPPTEELAALRRRLAEMSERLEHARAQERALEASRRELVAWVSHDLRTPLAGMRAMAEALEDGVVDDAATITRYHAAIRVEVDRLAALVDDLFELSRIQAGVLRLDMDRVSLGDLVSDALAASSPVAQAKGVRLEGRVDGDAPVLSLATPEVARALRNLMENAIHHTPRDGAVSVEVGMNDGEAFVAVSDACGGIPERDLDRVFDTAFRGERARTPKHDTGAGLGLAIVRGIAEAHHGAVDVSNVGPGCRFVLRLPLNDG